MRWYDQALTWSKDPKANTYLVFLSFIDASVFPISPMLMVLPMSMAAPERSFRIAGLAILGSFFGGIVGYALGYLCFESFLKPFILWMGYEAYYQMALRWFEEWGFWAVLFGCFAPMIPYKIFTISAGVLQLNFGLFLLASSVGRSLRFLIMALLIYWGGPYVEPFFRKALAKISQ